MKRLLNMLIISLLLIPVKAQQTDTLTLEECLDAADLNSPANRQKILEQKVILEKIRNLNTNWLPSVGFNAQASYNSETTEFSEMIGGGGMGPAIPSLPLDQYKVWAELNQQIYDGGATKAMKSIEKAGNRVDIQQTEIDRLNIRQQTAGVYFSLLSARKSREIISVSLDELRERKKIIRSGIDNGVILQENMLALDAQEISLLQKITELSMTGTQLVSILQILTDSAVSLEPLITEPVEIEIEKGNLSRPEYVLFQIQKEKLEAGQKLIESSDMPRLFAFSQFAYGRPGYNMVSRDFHTFYTVGAGMKWNFLGWGDNRRQIKVMEIQKQMMDVKKDAFDDQLNVQLEKQWSDMVKYDSLMKMDRELVKLRKAITESGMSRLKNGIITATDFLTDLNAEITAELQYENHRILKLQAIYSYALLQGKY